MSDEIKVHIKGTEDVSDALGDVQGGAVKTERVIVQSMGSSEEAFDTAVRSSGKFGSALDKVTGFSDHLSGTMDGLSGAIAGVRDIQNASARRSDEQARKYLDVEQSMEDTKQAAEDLKQAQLDLNQAQIDSKQAAADVEQSQIDAEQALIDAQVAQEDYNESVAEFGPQSAEARQAANDLEQAHLDLTQANIDEEQAIADKAQYEADAAQATRDMTQADIDAKGAQLDLNEAQRNAVEPTTIEKWGSYLQLLTPIIIGISSATEIATAAQWLWNIAMSANPIGLIVIAVAALIAIIVLIATKTTWFQDLWNAIWGAIGDPVKAVFDFIIGYYKFMFNTFITVVKWWWDMFTGIWKAAGDFAVSAFRVVLDIPNRLRSAFNTIGDAIFAPFKYAFNMVSWAWNNTIGRLSWSVPGWVPGIGGASISAPRLPQLQHGGEILRSGAVYAHQGEIIAQPASVRGLSNEMTGNSAEMAMLRMLLEQLLDYLRRMAETPKHAEFVFSGNLDSALATVIMKLIRTGKISIRTT